MERWDKTLPLFLAFSFFPSLSVCKAVYLGPEMGSVKEIRWVLIPENKIKIRGTTVFSQMFNPNLG